VSADELEGLRRRVRARLVANLGPVALDPFAGAEQRDRTIRAEIERTLDDEGLEACLAERLFDDLAGLGPLQPLMEDDSVTDILVNRHDEVFVERRGRLERTAIRFRDQSQLEQLIQKVVALVGREISIDRPLVDARLADGSRANAVFAPVGGPTLCIRKFSRLVFELLPREHDAEGSARPRDWVSAGGMSHEMARFLAVLAQSRSNILVAGATGAGKSTLLRSIAAAMPPEDRVITIEDTAELQLSNPHWVKLEVVHGGEAGGSTAQRRLTVADLVQNALRMRPDRLVIGEIRHSAEALHTLEALNTGHDGSTTTIHASGTLDALARLEMLVARDFAQLEPRQLRAHIARVIDVVLYVTRTRSGRRAVMEIAEVLGVGDSGHYELATVFAAEPEGDEVTFRRSPGYLPAPRLQRKLELAGVRWP
jgi:pilus assembly protein CpaF